MATTGSVFVAVSGALDDFHTISMKSTPATTRLPAMARGQCRQGCRPPLPSGLTQDVSTDVDRHIQPLGFIFFESFQCLENRTHDPSPCRTGFNFGWSNLPAT
jgi:hypothetical protein